MIMEEEKAFEIILNYGTQKECRVLLDYGVCAYNLYYFNSQTDYFDTIFFDLIENPRVIQLTNQFIRLQNYQPAPVIKSQHKMPIKTKNYAQMVTHIKYYQLFKRYTDLKNADEAVDVMMFAKLLSFDILFEAVGTALAVNFWVDDSKKETQKQIDKTLSSLDHSQISQLMKENCQILKVVSYQDNSQNMNRTNQ